MALEPVDFAPITKTEPCALGLATPMSIMVGTGRGAQAGVLIRNIRSLGSDHGAAIY